MVIDEFYWKVVRELGAVLRSNDCGWQGRGRYGVCVNG
jgi:hypothetical protein